MKRNRIIRGICLLMCAMLLLTGCGQRTAKPKSTSVVTGTEAQAVEETTAKRTTPQMNPSSPEMSAEDIADYLRTRVVTVRTDLGTGSGFFIDDQGTIVTNFHVIDGGIKELSIETNDAATYSINTIVNFSPYLDVAILKADISGNDYLTITDTYKQGATVYAYGAPRNLNSSFTSGVISSTDRKIGLKDCIQIDAAINPGNSGGPLVNTRGQVIAINAMKRTDSDNIGFSIKMSALDQLGDDKDYSLSRFQDWYNKEISRSYLATTNGKKYSYTFVHTYTTETGAECLGHGDDLGSQFKKGYAIMYKWYAYSYDVDAYDQYCDYLYSIGYEYEEADRAEGLEATCYIDQSTGYKMFFCIDTQNNILYVSCPMG